MPQHSFALVGSVMNVSGKEPELSGLKHLPNDSCWEPGQPRCHEQNADPGPRLRLLLLHAVPGETSATRAGLKQHQKFSYRAIYRAPLPRYWCL